MDSLCGVSTVDSALPAASQKAQRLLLALLNGEVLIRRGQ